MTSPRIRPPATVRRAEARSHRLAAAALMNLAMSGALMAAILVAAGAVSMGVADAQGLNAMTQPDTGLVLGLMLCAVGVMGALSAVAMRLAGRSRQR